MEQHNKPVCELLCIDFCNKYEEQKSTIRELEARIAALTKDAERLKFFNQVWRWKALKDGEIIYQYGEHVPALFQKTAELLPAHPPAPQPDAEPVAWNIYSKNGEELLFLEQNKDSVQRRIDAGYVVKPCYEGNPPAPNQAQWQPIDTAPATPAAILLLTTSRTMKIETGHWARNMVYASKSDGDDCFYTHWMPLPNPPIDAAKEKP